MAFDFTGAFQKLDDAFGKASEADGFGREAKDQLAVQAIDRGPEEFFYTIAQSLGTSDPVKIMAEANRIAAQRLGGGYA